MVFRKLLNRNATHSNDFCMYAQSYLPLPKTCKLSTPAVPPGRAWPGRKEWLVEKATVKRLNHYGLVCKKGVGVTALIAGLALSTCVAKSLSNPSS
jgi:hypothetical protein